MVSGVDGTTPNGPVSPAQRYLSAQQAADLLGVYRATVIDWARQGKFGGYQFGKRGIYRFTREDIVEFLNKSRVPTLSGLAEVERRRSGTDLSRWSKSPHACESLNEKVALLYWRVSHRRHDERTLAVSASRAA
ncbi:MAG: helix-turn-helix domain-containing protein [Chloroflexota bacterium]|nr:helix-turn-helix domain-containing protein [Chloroflexota bacterium]